LLGQADGALLVGAALGVFIGISDRFNEGEVLDGDRVVGPAVGHLLGILLGSRLVGDNEGHLVGFVLGRPVGILVGGVKGYALNKYIQLMNK